MNIPIVSMSGGEFTPQLDCRSDTEKYYSGCRHLENMIPRIYGNVTRRPGTVIITAWLDWLTSFLGIVSYENIAVCFENLVVSTLADDDLMPKITCYENDIVCYENEVIATSGVMVFLDNIVCYENKAVFYENKIMTY